MGASQPVCSTPPSRVLYIKSPTRARARREVKVKTKVKIKTIIGSAHEVCRRLPGEGGPQPAPPQTRKTTEFTTARKIHLPTINSGVSRQLTRAQPQTVTRAREAPRDRPPDSVRSPDTRRGHA